MPVNLNNVYQNPDAWALNITSAFQWLQTYSTPAGELVMVWMHAPLIMIEPGVYIRLGHIFLIALLIPVVLYVLARL